MLKKLIISLMVVVSTLCFAFAAACGGQNDGKSAEVIIEFDKYELDLLVGEQFALTVSGISGKQVSWSTTDESVATVDDGVINAVSGGSAIITMTVEGGETVTCSVKVKEELTGAVNFGLDKATKSIYVGYTKKLSTYLTVGETVLNAADYGLTFTSDNTGALTVSNEGVIEAKEVGTATVKAAIVVDDFTYESSVTITVKTLSTVEANLTSKVLAVSGDYKTADVSAKYYESVDGDFVETPATFTYTSSDESVATVNASGKVTAVGVGTATIKAAAKGTYDVCTVTVYSSVGKINTAYDFMNIKNNMDGYYELNNDIDFAGITFETIGTLDGANKATSGPYFMGTLNGNGYSVKNITHSLTNGNNDAKFIFAVLGESGVIENIAFENVTFGGSRASRSAGVVWINDGTIRNVKVSLTTNGTGTANNEWGFGGITTRNNGKIFNCFVDITDNSAATYTGAIFTVNSTSGDNGAYNNVALVNKTAVKAYVHTGSYGKFSNNTVCLDTESVYRCMTEYSFANEIWNVSGVVAPTLKNDGNVFARVELLRQVSDSSAVEIEADGGELYTYTNGAKAAINYTTENGKIIVPYSTLQNRINVGENVNVLYLSKNSGTVAVNLTLYTAAFSGEITQDEFKTTIENDMSGYYILTGNVTFKTLANGAYNNRYLIPVGLTTSASYSTRPTVNDAGTYTAFNGTLNGRGYMMTYKYNWGGTSNHQYDKYLIYAIGTAGVIKNIGLDVADENDVAGRRAALACMNSGSIENCFIKYSMIATSAAGDACRCGVIYRNYGAIRNCVVTVSNSGTASGYCWSCYQETGSSITDSVLYKTGSGTLTHQATSAGKSMLKETTELSVALDGVNGKGINFVKGTLWSTDANAIYFNGTKVIG